ncbi:sensor histidine kinase [Phormidesmis sp. 146-33]
MSIHQALILVVDDNSTNIKVLFDVLQEASYRVLVAKNGESAIAKLQAVSPDLILLDVMMPGIDGFETCRRLKASEHTQTIPVIFTTALTDVADKVKGFSLGAVDYITKPFRREEVLARVQMHLKLRHLNQALEQRVSERTIELSEALTKLQDSQLQLVQSEKMSALGQLVAGVAHEINNPVGAVRGNLVHAGTYLQDLMQHLQLYQQQASETEIADHAAEIELDYLLEDLPKMLKSMKESVDRIQNISVSLRTFSRTDGEVKVAADLHEGLDSTLMILKHRLKASSQHPDIEVVQQYGDLPLVSCFPGLLNQVFMNLLANAIDALEESNHDRSFDDIKASPNQITLHTEANHHQVKISIHDNGIGMTDDVKQKIFDYLFTTKPIGKGTGIGLAIAHQIIVEKHQGTLEVRSELGQGSTFIITIPLMQNG